MCVRIDIDGNHVVTADVERDAAEPSGDGRIVAYIGADIVLTMTWETADQLADALWELADSGSRVPWGAVVYRS